MNIGFLIVVGLIILGTFALIFHEIRSAQKRIATLQTQLFKMSIRVAFMEHCLMELGFLPYDDDIIPEPEPFETQDNVVYLPFAPTTEDE